MAMPAGIDAADGQMRYRAWVTVGPAEMSFSEALGLLRVLNRRYPELSGIGSGAGADGQVYAVSCDARDAGQARQRIGEAFGDAISVAGLDGSASVVQIQLERVW
jgi:hypothetical protein